MKFGGKTCFKPNPVFATNVFCLGGIMIIKEEAQKIAEKEAVRDGCDFIRYLKTHGELFVFLAGFKTSQKTGLSLCYLVEQEWNVKAYSGTKYSMPREAFSQENRASCAFVCIVNDFEKV